MLKKLKAKEKSDPSPAAQKQHQKSEIPLLALSSSFNHKPAFIVLKHTPLFGKLSRKYSSNHATEIFHPPQNEVLNIFI
jgi:hypothetical protein